jgi:hypothetical protein
MRNFPPEKVVNAREDRLYQNPTNDVDVILCATRTQQSRAKMHNLGNDPWKRGIKRRHSREAGDAYGTRRLQVKYHSCE